MNRQMAGRVAEAPAQLPPPDPQEEGDILVISVDNKGVPMRRSGESLPAGARRKKGEKANKKQMATLGCVYTVDPRERRAEDVVAALFRERKADQQRPQAEPTAQQKRGMSSLSREVPDGRDVCGQEEVFRWMADEAARRHRPRP